MVRFGIQTQTCQGRLQAAEIQAVWPVGAREMRQQGAAFLWGLALLCKPALHRLRIAEFVKGRSIAWNVKDNGVTCALRDEQYIGRAVAVDVKHRNAKVGVGQ
ncbi:hypothetical protein D3C79_916820 [compost metagenome]